VLHCAGLFSHRLGDAERLRSVNVVGAELVLNAACKAGLTRVVFVSSALALSRRAARRSPPPTR